MGIISKDLGPVTAYAAAVNRGYTGTREEFETLMASYATVAEQAGESASAAADSASDAESSASAAAVSSGNASSSASAAAQSASSASDSATAAGIAQTAAESARDAAQSAQTAAEAAQEGAEAAVDGFDSAVTQAISDVNAAGTNQKELAKRQAEKSEAWAVGKISGEDVGVSDPAYHNNAKYYAESAGTSATTATTKASEAAQSAANAADSASAAAESARTLTIDSTLTQLGQAADAKKTGDEINDLKEDLNDSVNSLRNDLYGGEYKPQSWRDGMIYNHRESSNSTFQRTGEITLNKGETITFTGGKGTTALPVNALTRVVDGAYQALKYYSGAEAETITYTATVDMIVIVSTLKTLYGNNLTVDKNGILEVMQDDIDATQEQYDQLPEYIKHDIDATAFTLASSGSVQYQIVKGNTYIVKNNGTNTIALSTRTIPSAATTDFIVVGGGISKQFTATADTAYIVCSTACDFEISTTKTLIPFIDSTLNKFGNYGTALPLVRFDFNRTFGDYAEDLAGVDFMANNGKWYSVMQTVYDKFDSLVSEYPNYITRVDAGEDVGLTYPAYANLNGEASGNYSPTPTYRTYMYKLVDTNSYVYSSRNPRKKLFLIGSTHGNETAGAFNLYLFAKNLCEATNSDYFKLRESFDVYIVPCLNGYGMCHYVRWNADGVDINRNYPISNWTENGQPFVIGYTGPSPASEFETQLIVALQNKYSFDVAVDHHNYGASSSQFYTEFWYERFNAFANAALADCSSMFIENLPAYFGSNYRLFVDITNSTRPNVVLSDTMPCMAKWMYEQGLDFSATIEIGNQINYIDGELNTATDIPKYTNDVFKVGEFTLRNQLLYYCGFVLGSVV